MNVQFMHTKQEAVTAFGSDRMSTREWAKANLVARILSGKEYCATTMVI